MPNHTANFTATIPAAEHHAAKTFIAPSVFHFLSSYLFFHRYDGDVNYHEPRTDAGSPSQVRIAAITSKHMLINQIILHKRLKFSIGCFVECTDH